MLIFSTKLYVKKELTNEQFIDMVINWAAGSPNYSFAGLAWNHKDEYTVESENKAQKLTILNYNETILVRLINRNRKIIWTNEYVLTSRDGKRILSVQLYNDAEDVSAKLPNTFKCPRLLKTIIKDGYGDLDNNLDTNDKSLIITNENIDIIRNIILDKNEYMMPVVYVTSTIFNSEFLLNYEELAKDLAGVAHVLVEKDNTITKSLKETTESRNPYDAGVQIYFCKGSSQRLLPSYFRNREEFRKEVANAVFRRLILSKIDDDLSFSKIHISKVIENGKRNEEYNADVIKLYENELKAKENDLEARNNQIQELEAKISTMQSKILYLEQRVSGSGDKKINEGLFLLSQEYDLYECEQKDIVLQILKNEHRKMGGDANQRSTRKYHILESIIQNNKMCNNSSEIISQIRRIFSGDLKLTSAMRRDLGNLGFRIEERVHYRLTYKDDERYAFTMSKTSSDKRAAKNLRSEILKMLFCEKD